MTERSFEIEYRLFAPASPIATPEIEVEGLEWTVEWQARQSSPELFVTPEAVLGDTTHQFRQPAPFGEGSTKGRLVAEALRRSQAVGVLKIRARWDDLTPLQLALAIGGYYGAQGCVVYDCSSGIAYVGDEFQAIASAMNDEGAHNVRDAVRLEVEEQGEALRLSTRGLAKYGHPEILVEGWPASALEAARRYVYDNLALYAALKAPFEAGQTLAYFRADPAAKLYFSAHPSGALVVSDCHPTEKQAVAGLQKLLSIVLPAMERVLREEAQQEAEARKEQGEASVPAGSAPVPPSDGIRTLEDFVAFSMLLRAGRMDEAMQRFGLTHATLRAATDEWSAKLRDPRLAAEFAAKLVA
jgi:hypothetical protein